MLLSCDMLINVGCLLPTHAWLLLLVPWKLSRAILSKPTLVSACCVYNSLRFTIDVGARWWMICAAHWGLLGTNAFRELISDGVALETL